MKKPEALSHELMGFLNTLRTSLGQDKESEESQWGEPLPLIASSQDIIELGLESLRKNVTQEYSSCLRRVPLQKSQVRWTWDLQLIPA